jgi:hypothetical protein
VGSSRSVSAALVHHGVSTTARCNSKYLQLFYEHGRAALSIRADFVKLAHDFSESYRRLPTTLHIPTTFVLHLDFGS